MKPFATVCPFYLACQSIWTTLLQRLRNRNVTQRNLIPNWPLGRYKSQAFHKTRTTTIALFSEQYPLCLRKSALFSEKCPLFFEKCPFFFEKCPLFFEKSPLFFLRNIRCFLKIPLVWKHIAERSKISKIPPSLRAWKNDNLQRNARAHTRIRTRVIGYLLSHLSHPKGRLMKIKRLATILTDFTKLTSKFHGIKHRKMLSFRYQEGMFRTYKCACV